jgi:2-polyprenyl-3-methyl-5-hydroxy-6-metoxy-1,4-benzoquinol methylase
VRIATDTDLDAFVRQLLRLFENPKTRADLRNGRLSFRLAGTRSGSQAATHRVDRGAVTERQIVDIAASGGDLILGPKAVLTPLAREKARVLGVSIQKERK